MRLLKLAHFSLIYFTLKLMCADANSLSPFIYPDRNHLVSNLLETSINPYYLLLVKMLIMPSSISLDEAQELWTFMMKLIKKRKASESQPTYWLLRQG